MGALITTPEAADNIANFVLGIFGAIIAIRLLWALLLAALGNQANGPTTYGDAHFVSLDRPAEAAHVRGLRQAPENCVLLGYLEKPRPPLVKRPLDFERVEYSKPSHLLTVAPSRSGKGTCVIVPNLLRIFGGSVIVIDPKGENAAITAHWRKGMGDVYLLNPFNEHRLGTARFNPLAHLSIEHPNIGAEAGSLAEALVPAAANEGGNSKHFTDSARSLVQALLLHLVATKAGKATLPEMREVLANPRRLAAAIEDMIESPHAVIAQLASQFDVVSNEINSVISSARIATAFLSEPAFVNLLSGSDFRMMELKERPTTLYVILPSSYLKTYPQFLRLIVVSALGQLMRRAGGVKTLFMLDEFAALGHLSHVEVAFGQAAGFNIQLWPFLQDLNQLKDIYGSRWESFIANAGAVQWFAPEDQFTSDYLSKRLGQKTVFSSSSSESSSGQGHSSSSTSRSETGVPLMTPVALRGLKEYEQIITISGLSYPVKASRFPYFFKDYGMFGPVVATDLAALKPTRNPFHA